MRAMATKDKRTEQLFSLIRNGAQLNVWDQIELVWRLSLPAIFAQISFVMVQYIDAAMVGHLGANPAASIGLVSSSLWLVWGLITAQNNSMRHDLYSGSHCLSAVLSA